HVNGERHLHRPGDAVLVFLDHERLVELQLEVQLDVQEDVERLRARARVIRAAHTDARVARPIRVLLPERPMRGRAVVGPVDLQPQLPVAPRRRLALQQTDRAAIQRQAPETGPRLEHPTLTAALPLPVTGAIVVVIAPAPHEGGRATVFTVPTTPALPAHGLQLDLLEHEL